MENNLQDDQVKENCKDDNYCNTQQKDKVNDMLTDKLHPVRCKLQLNDELTEQDTNKTTQ